MILMIDNYDSFTYNLYQYVAELGYECQVYRNDAIALDEIETLAPQMLLISPGPGRPEDAGITKDAIAHFAGKLPIFGVCLGQQAIAEVFGGKIVHAPSLMHGKTSEVFHHNTGCFKGLASPLTATRYHSLLVERKSLPECLSITAITEDNLIMGLRHKEHLIEGVQFHPESIETPQGKSLIHNFLKSTEEFHL